MNRFQKAKGVIKRLFQVILSPAIIVALFEGGIIMVIFYIVSLGYYISIGKFLDEKVGDKFLNYGLFIKIVDLLYNKKIER